MFERWSSHDRIVIRPQDVQFQINVGNTDPIDVPKIVVQRQWQDTWSLRLGGELHVLQEYGIHFRGGYFYEPSAIPPEQVNASRIDLDKHGFTAGVAGNWRGFQLELSAMYVALQSQEVRNSEQKLPELLPGAQELLTTLGNGDYSGRYFLFSAGLTVRLAEFLESLEDA